MNKPNRLIILGFLCVILFWGGNSFVIKIMTQELAPFWSAALRFALAASILFAVALARGERLPRGRELVFILAYGALLNGVSVGLYYWGLSGMSAGLATIIFSLAPVLTVPVAVAYGEEPFRWRPLVGAFLALLGVAVAFSQDAGGSVSFIFALAIFLSALVTAQTTIMARRKTHTPPVMINAVAAAVGTLTLLSFSILFGEPRALPATPAAWGSLLYLAVLGTALTYFLYMIIARRWTASAASYAFVLTPFTAIAIEMMAGATPSPLFLVGGVIVLAGVWYGALSGNAAAGGLRTDG